MSSADPSNDLFQGATPQSTAVLLLEQTCPLDATRLVKALRQRHPGDCDDASAPSGEGSGGNSSVLRVAGNLVAILSVSATLPQGWQNAAERSIHWPDASAVCGRHRAHVVISLMGTATDRLARARLTTAVAGAYAATHPGVLAGLWDTVVLNSAEGWATLSRDAFAPYPQLPTFLWVSRHVFSDEPAGRVGVLTIGLSGFVGRELELTARREDLRSLLERAQGLATYLVQNGPVLGDGSTFGVSQSERIMVHHRVSKHVPGLPVLAGEMTFAK